MLRKKMNGKNAAILAAADTRPSFTDSLVLIRAIFRAIHDALIKLRARIGLPGDANLTPASLHAFNIKQR